MQELQRVNAQQLAALRALSTQQEDERAKLSAELKADFDAKAEELQGQVASLLEGAQHQEVRYILCSLPRVACNW